MEPGIKLIWHLFHMEHVKSNKNESIYLGRTEQVLDFYAVHMAYSLCDSSKYYFTF